MESPFKDYVSSLAKKDGNEALSFFYKILIHSLYGRFGINPNSTITEICDQKRYEQLMKPDSFITSQPFGENRHIVTYHSNIDSEIAPWGPASPELSGTTISRYHRLCADLYVSFHLKRRLLLYEHRLRCSW